MQFFTLIIINLFMWVIFYLVISLKLEKTASEFREKKLRKIMDEIMIEFNSIAERNISLLEKRITVLKKLLEKSGGYSGLDLTSREEGEGMQGPATAKGNTGTQSLDSTDLADAGSRAMGLDILDKMKVASKSYLDRAKSILAKTGVDEAPGMINEKKNSKLIKDISLKKEVEAGDDTVLAEQYILNIDTDDKAGPVAQEETGGSLSLADADIPDEKEEGFSMESIPELFNHTKDKYSLIKDLHSKGLLAEDISKYSGIPIGEIRLVLNLHGV